jgi:hypothetical protein
VDPVLLLQLTMLQVLLRLEYPQLLISTCRACSWHGRRELRHLKPLLLLQLLLLLQSPARRLQLSIGLQEPPRPCH